MAIFGIYVRFQGCIRSFQQNNKKTFVSFETPWRTRTPRRYISLCWRSKFWRWLATLHCIRGHMGGRSDKTWQVTWPEGWKATNTQKSSFQVVLAGQTLQEPVSIIYLVECSYSYSSPSLGLRSVDCFVHVHRVSTAAPLFIYNLH